MEDVKEFLDATQSKITRLNDFITLSLRRKRISKELRQLCDEVLCLRDLMTEVHIQMQEEYTILEVEYERVMSEMRKKQIMILSVVIKEKERKQKEAEEEEKKIQLLSANKHSSAIKSFAVKSASKSAVKFLGDNLGCLQLNQGNHITPRMKIRDYKESPLVKRKVMPQVSIQFLEFDVQITQQQFDKIPKYMCGRETLDLLNEFLQSVIVTCFNEKYQLIHKQRNVLRNNNDVELWKMYNDQASYLPGKMFITPGDITRIVNKMLDKKAQNRLTMLRHIGILQEQRVKSTVCYVWCHSGL